jgi:hypothetical protein
MGLCKQNAKTSYTLTGYVKKWHCLCHFPRLFEVVDFYKF